MRDWILHFAHDLADRQGMDDISVTKEEMFVTVQAESGSGQCKVGEGLGKFRQIKSNSSAH